MTIGLPMMAGAILFLICDIQVLAQIIAKENHEKYNDDLHIITNNLFYYTALMLFIFSTFK